MKLPRTASVIINTYNRAAYLPNTVRSLAAQTYPDLELIIVNGPSSDNTKDVLREFEKTGLNFTSLDCASRNLSESRNIGISAANGDVIFFIDDDAVAHPSWVERIMRGYSQQNIGAVGGFTIDHTGITYQCKYTVCDRKGNARFYNTLSPESLLQAGDGFMFPSLLGTNCSFRADVIDKVNGFDEVFAYMLDETDVCAKIFDLGYRAITLPDALVFHKYAPSHTRNTERIPTALLAPARSRVYFTFKHAHKKYLDTAAIFEEVGQYRKDIEFANRWYLDHKKISPDHYLKLYEDLNLGIDEGIALGMDRTNFTTRSNHLSNWKPARYAINPIIKATKREDNTNKLRIYFVSQGYPPSDTSGIARWTYECAQGLVALGHEIHVLTRTAANVSHVDYLDGVWIHYLDDKFDDDQIWVAPVSVPDGIARRATAVYKELVRADAVWGVDVVSAPIWDVEGLMAQEYFPKPVVLSLHTTYALTLPFKPHWKQDAEYRAKHVFKVIDAEKWMLENASVILGNSNEIVSAIDDSYGTQLKNDSRLSIVLHGVNVPNSIIPAKKIAAHNGAIKILFVGRLEERKGPDILLQSLLHIKSNNIVINAKFVGKLPEPNSELGKLCFDLKDQINLEKRNVNVDFVGFVADETLADYYQDADIFVAPSRFESFGLILIEAMSFGLPVIAGDIGGMREIITHGTDGYLFNVESPLELAAKIDALVSDVELIKKIGNAARMTYETKFTREKMAQELEVFFSRTVAEANK